jgi:hypothetical protein
MIPVAFTNEQVAALKALQRIWSKEQIVLIGASAAIQDNFPAKRFAGSCIFLIEKASQKSYYRKIRLDFRYATTFATMVTSFAG